MGRKKPTARDEDDGQPVAATTGKAKKKGYVVTDDEYSIGNEILDDNSAREDDSMAPTSNKKKGKKGGPKKAELRDEDVLLNEAGEAEEEDDAPVISFAGKKKSKDKKSGKGSSVFASSNFDLLGEDEEEKGDVGEMEKNADDNEEQDTSVVEFHGKKKPSKSKRKNAESISSFNLLEEEDQEIKSLKDGISEEEEEDFRIAFTGKKKKKQKKPSGNSFSVALLEPDNTDDDSLSQPGSNSKVVFDLEHEEEDTEINFTGKKKPSRKKSIVPESTLDADAADPPTNFIEPDQHVDDSKVQGQVVDAAAVTSKNKKKKKKGGKPGPEDDDLDKILAEIDGPQRMLKDIPDPVEAPAFSEKREPDQTEMEEGAAEKNADGEGPAETAAAKKKKKKKEKDKEKKAAATAPAAEEKNEEGKTEATTKVSNLKVPKHVREMQEKLARLKEAEEKKRREEEERLRKEEEERRRQEELERLAEERKRLKKEREKEKIQKKKQEGTYLTQKEKLEARRREIARNQLLANSGLATLPTGESAGVSVKRPIYQKKKPKPLAHSNGLASSENVENEDSKEVQLEKQLDSESVGYEISNEIEPSSANQKSESAGLAVENGIGQEEEEADDSDDEEWDAKSWENADLNLKGTSAFVDEEIDVEPQPTAAKPVGLTAKALVPPKNDHVEVRKKDLDVESTRTAKIQSHVTIEKKSKKEAPPKEELSKSEVLPAQNGQNLRSPICCIMGHVDTGKTKLLDCIRGTNVQEGEAGGITQQIGATYFPAENIRERTRELKADAKLNVPGLLVIDTPGHESFTNLRSRGSGLCDIAILVVDIMHGLEPQTIESLNLLKLRNTEFIVALNKVDRLYGWKTCRNAPIIKAIKQQSRDVQMEFESRLTSVKTQFMMEGLNTELYYKNKEMGETYNIVPTSAISGEGVPDLLLLLVQWAQKTMTERLTFRNEVECTVLEVKVVEGHGTTIDVVLVNGVLHEGDQIVVCGLQGPIVTTIRALLTPHPMKELRVKGTYLHHKEIKAAQGIKITAQGLEHAVAGTSLYVVGPDDDLEDVKDTAMEDMKSVMSRIDKSGEGVYVQASTLGSLEALLEFLKSPAVNIPVSGISIGPVHKKDVMKASVMLEKKKEYGTILAFDVKVTQEARELADEYGVKIFIADIIYHLFDQFKAYIDDLKEEKKKEAAGEAVFPCVLKIVPGCVFNKKDPIVLGVDVIDGIMKVGTPLCVPQKDFIDIGCISSIENNHKPVDFAKKGEKVAIKVVSTNPEDQKIFGRHFEIEDELVSKISRNSLDALKEHYAADLSKDITRLLFTLKRVFKIP